MTTRDANGGVITPAGLDRLEELERKANCDEWRVIDRGMDDYDFGHVYDVVGDDSSEEAAICQVLPYNQDNPFGNAQLIAESRNALPALITAYRQALARIERLEGALRENLGTGHVLDSRANHIKRWHSDPKCDVAATAEEIQALRLEMHKRSVAAFDPEAP